MRFRCFFASLLCALPLAGCSGGAGGAGSACERADDCGTDLTCVGPDEPHFCGIDPRQECTTTLDCPEGMVCSAVADACRAGGFGSACQMPCGGTTCSNFILCNAQHACEPVACDKGYTCPAWQRCDPEAAQGTGPVFTRSHGCVQVDCTDDSGCPSGQVCVTDFCQEGAGVCGSSTEVP